MQVHHYSKDAAQWYDISSFLVKANPLPVYERNRDWMPVISDWDCEVSVNYGRAIKIDDKIKITLDGGRELCFIVSYSEYNYETCRWELETKHNLYLLQQKTLCRDNLHALVSNTSDPAKYTIHDNFGYNNFSLLWVLQNMFINTGLTLDTSLAVNDNIGFFTVIGYPQAVQVYGSDLRVDEIMLYMFGVGSAIQDFYKNEFGDYTYKTTERKTYWDYVSSVCSLCGWQLLNTGPDAYKLFPKGNLDSLVISDNLKFSYEVSENFKKYNAVNCSVYSAPRKYFYKTFNTALTWHYEVDPYVISEYTEELPYNFRLLCQDKVSGTQPGDVWENYILFYGAASSPSTPSQFRECMRDSYTKDYKQITTETELQSGNFDCLSHYINLESRKSKIVTEEFL